MTTFATGIPDPTPKEQWIIACLIHNLILSSNIHSEHERQLKLSLVRKSPGSTFFLRAVGEPIEPYIQAGDLLVVNRTLEPRDQSLVVITLEDSLVVKKLRQSDNHQLLISVGSQPSVEVLDPDQPTKIWGVITNIIGILS